MGEKGGVVGGKIILQVAGHDELEKKEMLLFSLL